jgi:hypothetical protein
MKKAFVNHPFTKAIHLGGEDEDRTHDLYIANVALSQLSYPPKQIAVYQFPAKFQASLRIGLERKLGAR